MSRRAWLAFAALSILWGIPYLFIKIAVHEASPMFIAWSRILVGAVVLLPVAWRLGAFHGLRARSLALVAYAALETAVPFVLIPLGETFVSSSLTAILISGMPLLVALLALRFAPQDRVTPTRLVGLVVGLAGVVTLMGVDASGRPRELVGAACILGATLCYAASPIVVKRHLGDLHPMGSVGVALGISAIALTPFGVLGRPATMPSPATLVALAVLGVLCTALALVVYFFLVTQAGPGRASITTYVNPAVAVLLGVIVLGEPVTLLMVAELLLIAAGSWLSTDGRLPPGAARRLRSLTAVARPRAGRRRDEPAAGSMPPGGGVPRHRAGSTPDGITGTSVLPTIRAGRAGGGAASGTHGT
jgi:drug/metabolite transporter (DMT)-like permease